MPTLLIVDDEALDRELARYCLASIADLEILEAGDGEEALSRIASRPPDLVLTDLRMPRMDGLALVQKVCAEFPLVPVILMTSKGSEQIAVRALKAGAASYVPKGSMRRELAETVVEILEVAEARKSRRDVLRHLRICETRFEMDNDPSLIAPLSGYCQDNLERLGFGTESERTQVTIALIEAVSNAMIHGNLEVGSDLKRRSHAEYAALIERRRREAPYAARRVLCTARETPERVEYVVADDGPGFDLGSLPDPRAAENLTEVSGRGVMLIRTFMDEVAYDAEGTRVTMAKSVRGVTRSA